jgi:hypothetical protein
MSFFPGASFEALFSCSGSTQTETGFIMRQSNQ